MPTPPRTTGFSDAAYAAGKVVLLQAGDEPLPTHNVATLLDALYVSVTLLGVLSASGMYPKAVFPVP